jgi:hypothetical protein
VGSYAGEQIPNYSNRKKRKKRKKEGKVTKIQRKKQRKPPERLVFGSSLGAPPRRSKSAPGEHLDGRRIIHMHVKKKEEEIRTGRKRPKPPFPTKQCIS